MDDREGARRRSRSGSPRWPSPLIARIGTNASPGATDVRGRTADPVDHADACEDVLAIATEG